MAIYTKLYGLVITVQKLKNLSGLLERDGLSDGTKKKEVLYPKDLLRAKFTRFYALNYA